MAIVMRGCQVQESPAAQMDRRHRNLQRLPFATAAVRVIYARHGHDLQVAM